MVREASAHCNRENLIAQLKNGVHAMRVPVDGLVSDWAYMVMASPAIRFLIDLSSLLSIWWSFPVNSIRRLVLMAL